MKISDINEKKVFQLRGVSHVASWWGNKQDRAQGDFRAQTNRITDQEDTFTFVLKIVV